jgi:membrane protein implicated in regulation of membrane protease activity
MAPGERKLLLIFGIGCLCIISTSILLFSLWSYRVPIFFLLVGLVALQVIVTLALRVVQTVADTTVKLHEQKLRQERLRPNDNGYYEIPLDGGKVPTFPSSNTQYQEEQEPYSNGYTPTQSYKGRWN